MTAPSAHPARLGPAFWTCAGVSLAAMAVNILGEATGTEWMHAARWLYTPPLVVGMALAGRLRSRRGWRSAWPWWPPPPAGPEWWAGCCSSSRT